jgi:hypothetical protein
METTYNPKQMLDIFWDAALILKRGVTERQHCNVRYNAVYANRPNDPYQLVAHTTASDHRYTRAWHAHQQQQHAIHPVVIKAMGMARPDNWQLLLLEWPHKAQSDPSRLAYTTNERKGLDDKQAVTTVGKYLTRHFSTLPDHAIRDLAALCGKGDCFIVNTSVQMIHHLERGPKSCMQWGTDSVEDHPYQAYAPEHGWGLAVRTIGSDTVGRALVVKNEGEKYFVRSYFRNDDGYSGRDDVLEAWLKEAGYEHRGGWNYGQRLKHIDDSNDCGFVAPYLDGCNQRVSIHYHGGVGNTLVIDDDGEYECSNTDGDADSVNSDDCSDCGDRIRSGDGYWVGYHEDNLVCSSCEDGYRLGRGRGGREYRFSEEVAVYVDSRDEYYHQDYFDDNNIVELDNGNYEHVDDAIEIDGSWYTQDDENICLFQDTQEWGMQCDGWQCTHSCDWYTDAVECVEINGEKFHPDVAPETEGE